MGNQETGRELKSSLTLTLKSLVRELDLAVSKSKVFADNLKAMINSLHFEPCNWIDESSEDPRHCLAIENGVLKVYDSIREIYMDLTTAPDVLLPIAFRLLELIENGTLKVKEWL
jgi:hypothetical protein